MTSLPAAEGTSSLLQESVGEVVPSAGSTLGAAKSAARTVDDGARVPFEAHLRIEADPTASMCAPHETGGGGETSVAASDAAEAAASSPDDQLAPASQKHSAV